MQANDGLHQLMQGELLCADYCICYVSLLSLFRPLFALEFNMPRGVTDTSQSIFGLHMTIFYICLAIAIIVFGVMFWSIFHHRKSKGATAAQFHGSVLIEIVWTIIPLIILVLIAIPSTITLVDMYDAGESDIQIE